MRPLTIVKLLLMAAIFIVGYWAISTYVSNTFFHGYNGKLSLSIIWTAVAYVASVRILKISLPNWVPITMVLACLLLLLIVALGYLGIKMFLFFQPDVVLLLAPIISAVILLIAYIENSTK